MKHYVFAVLFTLIACVCAGNASPQAWTSLTTREGLPDDTVTSIAFDRNGALWAATRSGLARYDGIGMETFTDADGFPFSAVNALRVGPKNEIWVTASRRLFSTGIAEYTGGKWAVNRESTKRYQSYINQFAEGPDNTVWAVGSGLYRFDGVRWEQIEDSMRSRLLFTPDGDLWVLYYGLVKRLHKGAWIEYLPFGNYDWYERLGHSIAVSPDNKVWASLDTMLVRYDGAKWDRLNYFDPDYYPPYNIVSRLTADSKGGIWAATRAGAGRYDGERWQTYHTLADDRTTSSAVAPDGSVWFGTYSGASRFDGVSWTTYRDEVLPDRMVADVAAAPDGSVWFATPKGAARFDGAKWTTFGSASGLVNTDVRSVAIGPDGAVWFATGGGVSRFDGKVWRTFTTSNGLVGNRVRRIAFAPDGAMWVATENGVSRFDGSSWKSYTTADGLASNDLRAIFFDADGTVWFATAGGVSRLRENTWVSWTLENGLASDDTWDIVRTSGGALWVATSDGIGVFDGGAWSVLAPPPRFADMEAIWKIAFTSDGAMWLGTSGGLYKYVKGRWTRYTTSDGLPAQYIPVIEVDSRDRLWLGTKNGLCRMGADGVKVWNTGSGLIDNVVNSVSFAPDSTVWISTPKGIMRSDGDAWTTEVTKEQLGYAPATVMIGRNGKAWAGLSYEEIVPYYEGGAARFENEKWTVWNEWGGESRIATNNVTTLAVSSKGEVWVGTADLGVNIFMGSWWKWYTYGTGLPNNDVSGIFFDLSDNPWLNVGDGLFKYDGVSWKKYSDGRPIFNTIYPLKIAFAHDGTMWAGTYNGVSRFDGTSWTPTSALAGIGGVTSLIFGPDGAPWAGGGDWYGPGVFRFNGQKWQVHRSGPAITSLAAGPDGGIFAGTLGAGVVRVDQTPLGTNDGERMPLEFALTGNHPNPFNPSTTISFALPRGGQATLAVYDITGKRVRTLVSGFMTAGAHSAIWNGRDDGGRPAASGVYFAQLRAGTASATRRMVLLK